MSIKLLSLAAGAIMYAIFMIALFPAPIAYKWLAPNSIELSGVQGRLWSGGATTGFLGDMEVKNIHWEFVPLDLFVGRITGKVNMLLGDGFVDTKASATFNSLTLQELRATFDLQVLENFIPIGATQGKVFAQIEHLVIEEGWPIKIIGELRLMELMVAPFVPSGAVLIPIGSFRLAFLDNSKLGGTIEHLNGPLETNGNIELRSNRVYDIKIFVKALPDASQELLQGLELMTGEPNNLGFRAFNLTGSL